MKIVYFDRITITLIMPNNARAFYIFTNGFAATAVDQNNKIEEQRAYATIGRVYLTKAQSQLNAPQKSDDLAKSIKSAEKQFLKSLLICKR